MADQRNPKDRPCDCDYKKQASRIDKDIRDLEEGADRRDHAIAKLEIAVAVLVVKSGLWGALAGLVSAVGILLLAAAKR